MKSSLGNYSIEFDEKGSLWNTFYKDKLLAVTSQDLWNIDSIAFDSQAAGEALLSTAMDIYGPMESILTEGELFKTPEEPTQDANPETGLPEKETIISKIQEAAAAKAQGLDVTALYAELDGLVKQSDYYSDPRPPDASNVFRHNHPDFGTTLTIDKPKMSGHAPEVKTFPQNNPTNVGTGTSMSDAMLKLHELLGTGPFAKPKPQMTPQRKVAALLKIAGAGSQYLGSLLNEFHNRFKDHPYTPGEHNFCQHPGCKVESPIKPPQQQSLPGLELHA